MVVNGLLGPCIGVAYYQAALQQLPTGVVLPIVALTPLVVIPLAMWLEKERPRLRSILAGCIAVSGAVWLAGGSTWVRKFF